ncbi:MAG: hypothetical protein HY541_05250 [Deltaproteobacteria bacterium]|nr:hypothetical protein [Deltaproteobacteria bacterium]
MSGRGNSPIQHSRSVLMGDPAFFSIKKGANPHTRDWLGFRKRIDNKKAFLEWHTMAQTLMRYGVQIFVIPAHPELSGLVFTANAGFMPDVETPGPLGRREFVLSTLGPARSKERRIYQAYLSGLGLKVGEIKAQFEGEADLIPWKDRFIFTFGKLKKQRFIPRIGIPPWKRVYGFRSDKKAVEELSRWVSPDRVLSLELKQEAFYHGDTVFCSFGPRREYLLAYRRGIARHSFEQIEKEPGVIWISDDDAREFAANSFQVIHEGRCVLFMPHGVSSELRKQIEKKGVETVPIDVSEFFLKGGGSVKCLIGDLGAWAEDLSVNEEVGKFRDHHLYRHYFANQPCAHRF